VGDDCVLPGPLDHSFSLFENGYRWYRPDWGRYTQSDPIGLIAGPNLFSYALNNPLSLIDPLGLRTCVIFVIEPSIEVGDYIAGLGTHHTLVYSDGCKGEPFLYDPSGSYRNRTRGSGGIFYGDEANPCDYFDYWGNGSGGSIYYDIYCFDTDECEQCEILDRAEEAGDPRGFNCSLYSSHCVSGIGGFPEFISRFPERFRRRLGRSDATNIWLPGGGACPFN